MGKTLQVESVYVVSEDTNMFRYLIPAELIGIKYCIPPGADNAFKPRLCYMLLWPDGVVDYWPVEEQRLYKFLTYWEKEKYLQDQRDIAMRNNDPLANEIAKKQLLVTWDFCDLIEKADTQSDSLHSQMFAMCRTGAMRYVTKINTDGRTFFDDGRISGLDPATSCSCDLYRPATSDEIARWLLTRLYSVKKKS